MKVIVYNFVYWIVKSNAIIRKLVLFNKRTWNVIIILDFFSLKPILSNCHNELQTRLRAFTVWIHNIFSKFLFFILHLFIRRLQIYLTLSWQLTRLTVKKCSATVECAWAQSVDHKTQVQFGHHLMWSVGADTICLECS